MIKIIDPDTGEIIPRERLGPVPMVLWKKESIRPNLFASRRKKKLCRLLNLWYTIEEEVPTDKGLYCPDCHESLVLHSPVRIDARTKEAYCQCTCGRRLLLQFRSFKHSR